MVHRDAPTMIGWIIVVGCTGSRLLKKVTYPYSSAIRRLKLGVPMRIIYTMATFHWSIVKFNLHHVTREEGAVLTIPNIINTMELLAIKFNYPRIRTPLSMNSSFDDDQIYEWNNSINYVYIFWKGHLVSFFDHNFPCFTNVTPNLGPRDSLVSLNDKAV